MSPISSILIFQIGVLLLLTWHCHGTVWKNQADWAARQGFQWFNESCDPKTNERLEKGPDGNFPPDKCNTDVGLECDPKEKICKCQAVRGKQGRDHTSVSFETKWDPNVVGMKPPYPSGYCTQGYGGDCNRFDDDFCQEGLQCHQSNCYPPSTQSFGEECNPHGTKMCLRARWLTCDLKERNGNLAKACRCNWNHLHWNPTAKPPKYANTKDLGECQLQPGASCRIDYINCPTGQECLNGVCTDAPQKETPAASKGSGYFNDTCALEYGSCDVARGIVCGENTKRCDCAPVFQRTGEYATLIAVSVETVWDGEMPVRGSEKKGSCALAKGAACTNLLRPRNCKTGTTCKDGICS